MRNWRSCELSVHDAYNFRVFLSGTGITYYTCAAYNLTHFDLLVTPEQEEVCNAFLETL